MSKAYEYGSEVGAVRIRPGIVTDLTIENERGIEHLTLGDPCTIDEADGSFLMTAVQRENQEAEQLEEAVLAQDTRIHRYRRIALTTTAGAIIAAGVVKGIRVWHKHELHES